MPGDGGHIEAVDELIECAERTRCIVAERLRDPLDDVTSTDLDSCEFAHRQREPVALGQSRTLGVDDEGNVRVHRSGVAEQLLQVDLAGRRGEEVVAADDLVDPLSGIVDDDGEVVGGDTVVAPQHHVVDHPRDGPVHPIGEDDLLAVGAQPQRRAAARVLPGSPRTCRQTATRAGVRAWRSVRSVRGGRDLVADLPTRAEAFVDEAARCELVDRSVVPVETVALADHVAVPVDAECGEIAQLGCLDVHAGLLSIEVLHAYDEASPSRPGRQPRDRGGTKVAEVQVPGRRGREASGHGNSVADHRPMHTPIGPVPAECGDRCSRRRTISYSRDMRCPLCATEVSEHQKFCHECGVVLSAPPPDEEGDEEGDAVDSDDDTESMNADAPTEPVETIEGTDTAAVTEPVETTGPAETSDASAVTDQVELTTVTEPVELTATTELEEVADSTEPVQTLPPPTAPADSTGEALPGTGPAEAPDEMHTPPVTAEMPALFDGVSDLAEYPTPREPFRVRMVFLLALFGAAAMVMSIVADVIDLRTTRPAPGITTGTRTLEDLGSNLGLAGFVGAAVMVLGGLLACFGLRWGAGLAGGAGLALAGWAGLSIGLAELPIAIAESITRTSSVQFTLRVTRDLGWWLIVGVGVIGVIVFLASLRWIGTGRKPALNPLVAAVTALATVVLALGPLVWVNDAVFADNFRSVDPARDLPAAFFAGRLGQVALIAFAGVVGMLIVRSYGLGFAVGGVSVSVWLWVSSLAEIGSNPVGIAYRNPGATDTVPHAVTTAGMVASLALLLIAAALATYRLNRSRSG
jgi:hypothetical protein